MFEKIHYFDFRVMFQICFLCYLVCFASADTVIENVQDLLEDPAVTTFREYIKIDTSSSENLPLAVEFWRGQARAAGLQFAVHSPAGKPVCVLTWPGADPTLPTIMLNSHMDVVPAVHDEWSHPPFAAEMDADGNIFGRGTQDTKDLGIQYLAAIKQLKADNVTLKRTVHITLMPDEETGGSQGMVPFLDTPAFKAMNVGFALDEGMSSPGEELFAIYQDRRPWLMKFTVEGVSGHAFSMPQDIAIAKLQRLMTAMLKYRETLLEALKSKSGAEYGNFTTLNMNVINGGTASNVIPEKFTLLADMRLSPTEDADEMLSRVNSWVAEAGNGTTVEFLRRVTKSVATILDDSNPYWVAMRDTLNDLGCKVAPIVCPATTDMLALRNSGIPAVGFATKHKTITRLHAPDEYVNVDIFLKGIRIYVALIEKLGNLPRQ